MPHTLVCQNCGKAFDTVWKTARFCSIQCVGIYRRQGQLSICPQCGKQFYRQPDHAGKFCSQECYHHRSDRPKRKIYHHVCKNCLKEFDNIQAKAQYCSLQCLGEFRKKGIPRICPQCGKQFYRQPSHKDKFCSQECYRHWPERSYRHVVRISNEKTCPVCGKRFRSSRYMSNDIYCSRTCYSKRPQTGAYKPCRHCGNPFYVIPAHAHNTYYCSRKCRLSHKGPSSIERLLQEELDRRNLRYESQYKIGRWSIDIAFPSQWLAVEADGDYWHSLPENQERDRRKDKVLRAHGWQVLRFTETEIQASAVACIDQVVERMVTPL